MQTYTIYKITNLINDKKYIGYTSQKPLSRYKQHINGTHNNTTGKLLYYAFAKHGQENFKFEVIYQSNDRDHCLSMETYFILEYKTFVDLPDAHGYNLTLGGRQAKKSKKTIEQQRSKVIGRKKPEGFGERLSLTRKGENNHMFGKYGIDAPNYGLKRTLEQCENIREGKISNPRVITNELRQVQSDAIKQAWADGKYANRPPISDETRKKQSDIRKGKKQTDTQKKNAALANSGNYLVQRQDTQETFIIQGLAEFAKSINLTKEQFRYTMTSLNYRNGYRLIENLGKNCKL
jgi:group I intron endonuclease